MGYELTAWCLSGLDESTYPKFFTCPTSNIMHICVLYHVYRICKKNLLKSTWPTGSFICPRPWQWDMSGLANSVWPWPLTLPMTLTLAFQDKILKISASQETSQMSLWFMAKMCYPSYITWGGGMHLGILVWLMELHRLRNYNFLALARTG